MSEGSREEERGGGGEGRGNDYQMVLYYCAAAAAVPLKEKTAQFEKSYLIIIFWNGPILRLYIISGQHIFTSIT